MLLNQVDVKDDKGCTPCLMAALNGHLKAVELLIDRFESKVMNSLLCFSVVCGNPLWLCVLRSDTYVFRRP